MSKLSWFKFGSALPKRGALALSQATDLQAWVRDNRFAKGVLSFGSWVPGRGWGVCDVM